LQGVIAHEFSHILNGDMRLNIRLMGLLFGLLVIAVLARTVLRFAPRGRGGGKKDGGVAFILLAAFVILIVGYVGLFFGRLIQAAVSRSRESLADASAIQFTRDPSGLRGALIKIGAAAEGSRIASPDAEEVAHMLFAPGIRRLFATHPALEDRLKAIDPQFDESEFAAARARMSAGDAEAERPQTPPRSAADRLDDLFALPTSAGAMADLVGNPGTAHIERAQQIRRELPQPLSAAGRHPSSARALFLALAVDENSEVRKRQVAFIERQLGINVSKEVNALLSDVDVLHPEQSLPLLMHAFPALRQLPRDERMQLMACLNGLWQREARMSLHAYVLRKLAQVHLRDDLDPIGRPNTLALRMVGPELQVLFSVLAHHGHENEVDARRAYEAGMSLLLPRERPAYSDAPNWPAQLDVALSKLDRLVPVAKEQLVEALVRTISHDERLTIGEAELLRAVCAALHCPLPPLIESSAVASAIA
jgi:hypothetical protein